MFRKRSTIDLVRPDNDTGEVVETPEEPRKVREKEPEEKPKEPKKERKPQEAHKKKEKKEKQQLKDYFRNKSFLGGICIIAALIIAFVVVPLMQNLMTTETASVVVLKQDVSVGQVITKDMVTTRDMLTYNLPDTVAYSIDEVVGKFVKIPASIDDILTTNHLTAVYPGDNPELATLPKGKLAISLALDTLAQSVSGKLRAGDVIQLYAVFKDDTSKTNSVNYSAVTVPELQYVEVLSVSDADAKDVTGQSAGVNDQSDDVGKIATVTIIVNEVQAKAVAGLEASSTLHAALAVRGDEERKAELLSAQETYFDSSDNSGSGITEPQGTEKEVS